MRTPRPCTRRALAALLVAALGVLGACGGDVRITSPGGVLSGGGTATPQSRGPVGRWTRTLLFEDVYGDYITSETTWSFGEDSVATRVNVVGSAYYGTTDVEVTTARWAVEGTSIVIRYVTPYTGTVRFRWRVERFSDGDVLWLDDARFVRSWN